MFVCLFVCLFVWSAFVGLQPIRPTTNRNIPDPTNGSVANRRASLIEQNVTSHLSPARDLSIDSDIHHNDTLSIDSDIHHNDIPRCTHTYFNVVHIHIMNT